MALSVTDLVKGLDFTGFSSATAADHNALVDGATPILDTSDEGKGFVIWTVDSASNVPRVPDPTISGLHAKWKRYVWIRVPFPGETNKIPKIYTWNDDATSIATYLKWRQIEADLSSVEADITALENDVADLQADIATISSNASTALSLAGTANTNASNALSTATAANTNATTAIANAAAAQTDADAAAAIANTANTNASSAITTANAASASVAASGPQFISPVTLYSAAGARAFGAGDIDVSANVPAGAKALMFQTELFDYVITTVNYRKDAGSSSYALCASGTGTLVGANVKQQTIMPTNDSRTFQFEVTAVTSAPVTLRLIGYIL